MTLSSSIQNLLYAKSQSANGTPATITQADAAIRCRSCTFTPTGELVLPRAGTWSATGLPPVAVQGGRFWTIAMQVELMRFSSYTDVESSPLSALLKAVGALSATTIDLGSGAENAILLKSSALYNPPTTPVPVTIEWHQIGMNYYRAYDCVGRIVGMAATGQTEILIDLEFQGVGPVPVESTFTAADATYGANNLLQTPMIFMGASLTSGIRRTNGTTEQTFTGLRQFGVTPGMTIAARQSTLSGAVNGYTMPYLTRSGESDTVGFTVDAHEEGDGTDDLSVWANWVAQAARQFRLTVNEGSGLQKMVLQMNDAQYNEPPVDSTAMPYREYDLVAAAKDPVTGATSAGLDIYFLAGT